LIEAAKWGRLDQMIFVSAPLTTRAMLTTAQQRSGGPPAVRQPSDDPNMMLGPGVLSGPGTNQPEPCHKSQMSKPPSCPPLNTCRPSSETLMQLTAWLWPEYRFSTRPQEINQGIIQSFNIQN